MKIWLINPTTISHNEGSKRSVVRSLFYNSPPLGLAYLAAVLEHEGFEVVITDAALEGLQPEMLGKAVQTIKPDLIGFTATTPNYYLAVAAARAIRASMPQVLIGVGGPHISANPDHLLHQDCFDFAVYGEGEQTMLEVVRHSEAGRKTTGVPGVITLQDGQLNIGPPRPLIEDLDSLPLPARHLLRLSRYRPLPNDQNRRPKTSIIASRGCPYQCIFCDKQVFGSTYRGHSPQRIVQEMHELENRYGIRDIAFVDSTFTPNRQRVEEILEAMETDPPRATWTCSCRANVLDEPLLRRMKTMNCWRIRIGVESGNEEILKRIHKGIRREDVIHTARTAYRLGFQIKCFFMVGHIGETPTHIEDSLRFALSLPNKDVTVQINTPLRGTVQFEQAKKLSLLIERDLSQYTFFQPVFTPAGMTHDQVTLAQREFYRRFYLRPIIFWRHLKAIRRPSDITKYFRAIPLVINLFSRR